MDSAKGLFQRRKGEEGMDFLEIGRGRYRTQDFNGALLAFNEVSKLYFGALNSEGVERKERFTASEEPHRKRHSGIRILFEYRVNHVSGSQH